MFLKKYTKLIIEIAKKYDLKIIEDISQDWELAEINNGNNEDIIYYKKNKLKHKNLIFKRKI